MVKSLCQYTYTFEPLQLSEQSNTVAMLEIEFGDFLLLIRALPSAMSGSVYPCTLV